MLSVAFQMAVALAWSRRTSARGDRQIDLRLRIDEDETDILLGLDLMFLAAAQVGDEPDEAGLAVRAGFKWPGAQTAGRVRGQHAHADVLDDFPDPVEVVLFGHTRLIRRATGWFRGTRHSGARRRCESDSNLRAVA